MHLIFSNSTNQQLSFISNFHKDACKIGLQKLSLVQCQRSFAAQKCLEFNRNVSKCEHSLEENGFPHACLIEFEIDGKEFHFDCSGSLISERFVMATAHCAYGIEKGKAKFVKIGDLTRPNSTYTYKIIERIKYPTFTLKTFDNDIALFKLDRDVEFNDNVRPICLPTQDETPEQAMFSGWSQQHDGVDFSFKLNKIKMIKINVRKKNKF